MSGIDTVGDSIAGITCKGSRSNNEDSILMFRVGSLVVLAVADGVGGYEGGEIASGIAVSTLESEVRQVYHEGMSSSEIEAMIRAAFQLAHEKILSRAPSEGRGMGTTLVAAFILGDTVIIGNTGDSRAYIISDESFFVTRDHSLVQSLIDQNVIRNGNNAPRHLRSCITRCLGGPFDVDIYTEKIEKSGMVLLSSDGLHAFVDPLQVISKISSHTSQKVVLACIHAALKCSDDNISVIVYKPEPGTVISSS
jgi:serine/threonine protein phosphatase PrpC